MLHPRIPPLSSVLAAVASRPLAGIAGRGCACSAMAMPTPVASRRARAGRCTSGNLRTALLAWCFARSRGAPFLLRIEDLDPQRSRPRARGVARSPTCGARHRLGRRAVRQSERRARHRAAFEHAARARARSTRCWCTRAEVRAGRAGAARRCRAPIPAPAAPERRERRERDARRPPTAWRLDAGGAGVVLRGRARRHGSRRGRRLRPLARRSRTLGECRGRRLQPRGRRRRRRPGCRRGGARR